MVEMSIMKEFITKNKIPIIILLLIAEGLFLRLFHLNDWLHFQLDQSRDSFLIKEVYEKGIGSLPLLGPRAGGSFLRLGPAYYYLMYLFVLITRSTRPIIFVLPEILASIAFVPMFYLLAKRLFTKNWSLILTALAVNSTFLITYDRFSWNPNLLPIFSVLTIYTFLKYLETKRKENYKNSLKWIALTALVVGIFVQMHFVAFVAIPIILVLSTIIFAIFYKIFLPKLSKKYFRRLIPEIGVLLAVFLITQTPYILNEYISKGTNTQQLFATVTEKEGKDASHNLPEKLVQNLWVYPKGYFISMTGIDTVDFPVWRMKSNLDIICDDKCRKSFTPTVIASILFLFSAISFALLFYKKIKETMALKKSTPKIQRLVGEWEFYLLLTVWVVVPWWAFYSLSFTLRPRFFLFSIVPFWIITGLFLRELSKNKLGKIASIALIAILLVSNTVNTVIRFNRLASASQMDKGEYPQDQILFQDESYPVVLDQEQKIADWIIAKSAPDTPYVFFWAPSYYYRPIMYLIADSAIGDKTRYMSENPQVTNASYFAVSRTSKPEKFFHGAKADMFEVIDYQVFGTLTVYQLQLTETGITETKSREKTFLSNERLTDPQRIQRKCLEKPKATCRFNWEDLF